MNRSDRIKSVLKIASESAVLVDKFVDFLEEKIYNEMRKTCGLTPKERQDIEQTTKSIMKLNILMNPEIFKFYDLMIPYNPDSTNLPPKTLVLHHETAKNFEEYILSILPKPEDIKKVLSALNTSNDLEVDEFNDFYIEKYKTVLSYKKFWDKMFADFTRLIKREGL